MAKSQEFSQSVQRAQQQYSTVCSKLRRVFQAALPEIHALKNENAFFSSRLMRLMYAKVEGRLPEGKYQVLGSVLQRVETLEPALSEVRMALKREEISDIESKLMKATEIADHFTRCSEDLDVLLSTPA